MMLNLNDPFAGCRIENLVSRPGLCREVYEAVTPDGQKVYLTVYDEHNSRMLMEREMPREFAMLSELKNPVLPEMITKGACSYYGRKMRYMTTKYYKGETLRFAMGGEPLPERVAVYVALEMMSALEDILDYTYGGGHYNINPDTVIISRDPDGVRVRIGGFDHVFEACTEEVPFNTSDLNMCCRAPETYYGRFSAATDVYAMGMLLGYMIQGRYPYGIDETLTECGIRAITGSGKAPELEMSEGLKQIVLKAVSKNVKMRYPDVHVMCAALKKYEKENDLRCIDLLPAPEELADGDDEVFEQEVDPKIPRLKISAKVRKGKGLKAVAGMEELKRTLIGSFVDVMAHRELAAKFNIRPNNIILFGPQGCGKTYISSRLAEECGMDVYTVNPSDLGSIYVHGTQGIIRDMFQKAAQKAKENKVGCMLLIDEIDTHLGKRDMVGRELQADEVAEWLVQLNDCVSKNVFVIGMTNRLDCLDTAAIRHGRFDKVFYVGLPDLDCRKQLLKMEIGKLPHERKIDYHGLAMMTEGFTAGDLSYVVQEAARLTFCACLETQRDDLVIKNELLKSVIETTVPSVSSEEMRNYERIWAEYTHKNTNQRQTIGYLAK